MDTLAKETMGLPVFICATSNQIVSSDNNTTTHHDHNLNSPFIHPSYSNINANNSSNTTSPITPTFFSSATATRSPTSTTFISTAAMTTKQTPRVQEPPEASSRDPRRNTYTYTPPTFSLPRRESILSTKRLSQAFDLAVDAFDVAWRKAEQMLGESGGEHDGEYMGGGAGMRGDLESGRREEEQGRFRRFGEGDGDWLD